MKKLFLKMIIALVFVILLDGLFFLFKDIHTCPASVWSALIGLNIAYISLFLVPMCAPNQQGVKVLSDTLYLIGVIYFSLEFIVGVTFLFWEQDTMALPVAIQAVLFGLYIIILLSNVLANDATNKSLSRQYAESDNVRELAEMAVSVRQLVSADTKVYALVTKLHDDLKSSPIRSNQDVTGIEGELSATLMHMQDSAEAGDMAEVVKAANQARLLVNKRNYKLKNIRHY